VPFQPLCAEEVLLAPPPPPIVGVSFQNWVSNFDQQADYQNVDAGWLDSAQGALENMLDLPPDSERPTASNDMTSKLGAYDYVSGHLLSPSNVAERMSDIFVFSQPEATISSAGAGAHTHTSTNLSIQEPSTSAISCSGPGKPARRVPCLVAGCGKTFRRPYLLDDHMRTHDGKSGGESYLLCSKEVTLTFTYSISLHIRRLRQTLQPPDQHEETL
jgi:hypothetical protein